MTRGRILLGVIAALSVAAAVVGSGSWGEAEPAPTPAAEVPAPPARAALPERRRPAPGPRRPAKAKRSPPIPELPAEDRLLAREEYREERLVDVNERLDQYAELNGWHEDDAEQVRVALLDNADRVTEVLQAVARGETTWEEQRDDLRQERLDRAGRVRQLLGDQEFDRFVREMDFARFFGEVPVRGRVSRR